MLGQFELVFGDERELLLGLFKMQQPLRKILCNLTQFLGDLDDTILDWFFQMFDIVNHLTNPLIN